MKLTAIWILLLLLLPGTFNYLQSQTKRVIVNTPDALYELTGNGSNCTYTKLDDICPGSNNFFSTALYGQTLYFISNLNNDVYSIDLTTPRSCRYVTSFPVTDYYLGLSAMNAFTVDKNGLLYAVDASTWHLFRCNPYTKETVFLGKVPQAPAGDLVFYEDKLLLATAGHGLYEINISNPMASVPFMSTNNYSFYGLISFPADCRKNKIFGFAPAAGGTVMVQLDLEAKTVGAEVCQLPFIVYDAGSIVETGNTLGIWVDSILIKAPCTPDELTGSVSVSGYSATAGELVYTLNNSVENKHGRFDQLLKGNYQLTITNEIGCKLDTSFTIGQGLSPDALITSTDPRTCELPGGSIFMETISDHQPVLISVNNGAPQTNTHLTGLPAGVYTISLTDQGSCRRDTTIILKYPNKPDFIGNITAQPTICQSSSGSIGIGLTGNTAGITAALNGSNYRATSMFRDLDMGYYSLSVMNAAGCRYDTLVQIEKWFDPKPQISFDITDRGCVGTPGEIAVHVNGVGPPFNYNLNYGTYLPASNWTNLVPGSYVVRIQNSNYCEWDTSAEVKEYIASPITVSLNKKDPDCKALNSGELRLDISGAETPYFFQVNDRLYGSGQTAQLPAGRYAVTIRNKDQCIVDTTNAELVLRLEPECERVSVPNAFSPNNDRNNDLFKPVHSPYLTQVSLTVYNRYGQIVFRSTPLQPAWDGSMNGRQLAQDYYAWVLTYRDIYGAPKKMNGLVLLLR